MRLRKAVYALSLNVSRLSIGATTRRASLMETDYPPRCRRPPPAGYIIINATADHRPLVRRDILLRRPGSRWVTPQDRRPGPRPGVRPGDDRCRPQGAAGWHGCRPRRCVRG